MAGFPSWVRDSRDLFRPTARHAVNATRHLSTLERKKLFSPDIEQMRTAEGRWFEAIVYEMFIENALNTKEIRAVVSKGADAPRSRQIKLGQNGFFYSRSGDITVRGNGQDLAEFDLMLLDQNNRIVFGEVVTSPSDLKEFEKEVAYKKRLLGYLFDQDRVPFLLVSSFDISHYSVVKRLMKSPDNVNIMTISCEEIKSLVNGTRDRTPAHPILQKRVRAPELPVKRPFLYQKYHDWERNRVFSRITGNGHQKDTGEGEPPEGLVKKILYGGLYPSAIKTLCTEREISIKGDLIGYDALMQHYSKVILATDLPDFEPLVYLRPRNRKEYLKMVQDKAGNFRFERRTPPKVGFFLWLESIGPTLGSRVTTQILEEFSPKEMAMVRA